MGALVTKALRPIKSFNIDNRAERVISKDKPVPAPLYPKNLEDLKRALESDPNLDEKLDKKDPDLDVRLRDVYVTSHGRPEDDITREKHVQNPDRPLPQDRAMTPQFEYGFKEPERAKYGRVTLRDTLNFISAHQTNPEEVTAAKIALEYKLKQDDVESILKYFKSYEVYIPETKKSPAIFAGPSTMRKEMENSIVKQIESKDSSVKELDTEKASKTAT
ncbi:protein NDUFAF4 homolog [Plodia interpunctella]|uniref:protein NDUFAF4 homolog n=1 Tax=Plodia interpunctella TaxID=58824 RepID=UPI002368A7C1|nr:protein NDUFAF4 homolog [Plodia interpunctella]